MDKWDRRFFDAAQLIASWSKDPRRKVGCVIVDDDHNQLSGGYNGFPRGVADTEERLSNKKLKNELVVHAEANAVATAARNGHSVKGSTAYLTEFPCTRCAVLFIQAGIIKVKVERLISPYFPELPRTKETEDDFILAQEILSEAKVYWQFSINDIRQPWEE